MTRFVGKNIHLKNKLYNEIGLYAQNILATLGSIVNKMGRIYAVRCFMLAIM